MRNDLHARRQVLESRDHFLHGVDDLDRVATRHAKNVQVHAILPVDRYGLRLWATAIFDFRDVSNEDRLAIDELHDGLANGLDAFWHCIGVDVGVEFRRDEDA